ncbi:MAG: permease-like cell division protein FtsX [Pseudomonadota bacterium]
MPTRREGSRNAGTDAGPDRQAAAERRRRRARREREAASEHAAQREEKRPPRRDGEGQRFITRLRTYGLRQAQMLIGALGRLVRTPTTAALTVAVIGVSLALPLALQLLTDNAKRATSAWRYRAEISAYLTPGLPESTLQELAVRYRSDARIATAVAIPAKDGLAWFRENSGMAELLETLTDERGEPTNPIPHALVLVPAEGRDDDASIRALVGELNDLGQVDTVTEDLAWLRRLRATLTLLGQVSLLSTVLLGIAALLVIANAIRGDVSARREEIVISRLIGASDSFVRQPFVFSGLWYGLGGGLVAVSLVGLALLALGGPVARLAEVYGTSFTLRGLGPVTALAVISGAAFLGAISAWMAADRVLRSMEPN